MTLAGDLPAKSRMLWILGLGGLIPFVVMTGLLAYAGREFIAFDMLVKALAGYGAVILVSAVGAQVTLGAR